MGGAIWAGKYLIFSFIGGTDALEHAEISGIHHVEIDEAGHFKLSAAGVSDF